MTNMPIRRPTNDRVLAGVCSAIGRALNLDPVLVRVAWVVFTLMGGAGVLAYLIAWLLIPDENGQRASLPIIILVLLFGLPLICFLLSIPLRILDAIF